MTENTDSIDILGEARTDESSPRYEIHIDNFNGPLDVLWDLIKRSKIDIAEISLSAITEQYLEFLRLMESLNFKVATEFIWMASELLYYKSKSLLPTDAMEDEYFTPPLPPELIQKLLEYKKYQMTSRTLKDIYDFQDNTYTRETPPSEPGEGEVYLDVSLFDLLRAFARVLESHTTVEREDIIFDEILVSDRIEYITELLKEKEMILFTDIFTARPSRPEIIATFLAILEMTKMKIVRVLQNSVFGDIRIARNFVLEDISS